MTNKKRVLKEAKKTKKGASKLKSKVRPKVKPKTKVQAKKAKVKAKKQPPKKKPTGAKKAVKSSKKLGKTKVKAAATRKVVKPKQKVTKTTKKSPGTTKTVLGSRISAKNYKKTPKKTVKKIVKKLAKKQVKKTPKKSSKQSAASLELVALNPKTGVIMPHPKPGAIVQYGVRTGKRVSRIGRYGQPFNYREFQAIKKGLSKNKNGFYTIFFEQTNETVKDSKGKIKKQSYYNKVTGKRKFMKTPMTKTKVVGENMNRKQKPVLYKNGEKQRQLDFGFKSGGRRRSVDMRLSSIVPIAELDQSFRRVKWSEPIIMQGATIAEALGNVLFVKSAKDLREDAANFFEWVADIRIRGGERRLNVNITVGGISEKLVDAISAISSKTRIELAKKGLRFTSLLDLETLAAQNPEAEEKIMQVRLLKIPVSGLEPIRPENEFGHPLYKDNDPKNPAVTVSFKMRPISD